VRPRRHAAHFFPHTRPPDTHALEVGTACLEYWGSLVNTYSSIVLRSMPKQRDRRTYSPRPAVSRPHDGLDLLVDNTLDETDDRASDDGALDMSMSFARGGSVGFGSRRHDHDPSLSPVASGAANGGFGSFGSRRHDHAPILSTDASGVAARGRDARDRSDYDERGRYTTWKKEDFPSDEALRHCKVERHEDLPRHIYLLFDILGLQFRWLLTRMGIGSTLVSSEELAVDDNKEHAWMTVYAKDRDVIEDLLYHRLKTLWSNCTDAIAIFSQNSDGEEFYVQKVWTYGTLFSMRSLSTISACRLFCLLANLADS